jgi:hypothetical protein
LIFWSRDIGQKTAANLDQSDREFLTLQLNLLGESLLPDLEQPLISGPFTQWKPMPMTKLSDYLAMFSSDLKKPDFIELLRDQHGIKREVSSPSKLDSHEQFLYAKLIIHYEQKRMQNFRETIEKAVRYKETFMVNDEHVHVPSFVNVKQKKSTPQKKTSPKKEEEANS